MESFTINVFDKKITKEFCQETINRIFAFRDSGIKKVNVFINPFGGSVDGVFSLSEVMRGCGIFFRGIVISSCNSSAMTILQSCQSRVSLPGAQFLIHGSTREFPDIVLSSKTSLPEMVRSIEKNIAEIRLIDQKIKDIQFRRVTEPEEVFRLLREEGVFFNSKTALRVGFIDKIVKNF